MMRTLRAKLVLSHVLLVMLCLALMGLGAAIVITRTQRAVNLQRTNLVATTLAQRLRQPLESDTGALSGGRPTAEEFMARLRREGARSSGRVVIISRSGVVLADSEDGFVGASVPIPTGATPTSPTVRRHKFTDGSIYYVVAVRIPTSAEAGDEAAFVAVMLPVQDVDPPWDQMLPYLLPAAGVVLLVALGLALLLSGRMTRPVRQMTRAAEAIAQGHYDEPIAAQGNDEIACLARAFDEMAGEVASSRRMQRDFLANVSHDLKTPLTSIQGFSQAILEGAVTDRAGYERAAEIIYAESERMARLVQDLLELARLEGGELEISPDLVSVREMVLAELHQARPRLAEKDLGVEIELPETLPGIHADAHQLGQAIANLVDNAVKYAAAGTTLHVSAGFTAAGGSAPERLTVGCGAAPDGGAWLWAAFRNDCEPIPRGDLQRLFERFCRGDRSRPKESGSGLGLAIVKETILAHGGYVEVGSDSDQGTCFRIWLPAD